MIKLVIYLHRKEGMSHEEFVDYWQNHHGPLVTRLKDKLRVKKYIQNVLQPGPLQDGMNSRLQVPPACDGIAESWYESEVDLATLRDDPEAVAALGELYQDELKFLDHSKLFVQVVRESSVF